MPKTYEEFALHKEWAGHVAIDSTDNEWLKAIFEYYGEDKATKVIKDIVAALQPVVTDGHLAAARLDQKQGRVLGRAEPVRQPHREREARRRPDRLFRTRSGGAVLRCGRRQRQGAASEYGAARRQLHAQDRGSCQTFLAKFGRIPTRADVESNPPGIVAAMNKHKVITALLTPEEERKWQKLFDQLFKGR